MKTNDTTTIPRLTVEIPADERGIPTRVGEEILQSRFSPAAWADALLAARENESEATAEYARIRTAELKREQHRRDLKDEQLEQRRLKCGGGVKSVKDLIKRPGQFENSPLNQRPSLSLMWLFALLIGSVGTVGCGLRLFGAAQGEQSPLPAALLCGVSIVAVFVAMWALLPKHWLRFGYQTGLGGATALACMMSFYLGSKVLISAPQGWQLAGHRIVSVSSQNDGDAAGMDVTGDAIVLGDERTASTTD